MTRMPPVRILTAGQLKGEKWSARYPEKAGELYVVATTGKKRQTRRIGPPTPDNQVRAERLRAGIEKALALQDLTDRGMIALRFCEAREAFARRGLRDHAAKTRDGRGYQLARLEAIFGADTTLDRIDADAVVRAYTTLRETVSDRTAGCYLDALSRLYQWHELENPVPAARERIKGTKPRTAATRALDDANCRPVPSATMSMLWPRLSGDTLTTALLCHDAGLRIGEATGLDWSDITWGQDEDDTRRSLAIERQRTNGHAKATTKSGRRRSVAMSRRLRAHLRAAWLERGRPARGFVVDTSDHKGANRRLRSACLVAKIDPVHFKDLRDTYASTLITHGIVLKWISLQLGHGSVAVTERHYARYMAIDGYQNPWIVPAGAVPSDLFAALDGWTHHGTHSDAPCDASNKKGVTDQLLARGR